MTDIAVINSSTALSNAKVQAMVEPFQEYVDQYLKPAWDVSATLHFVPKGKKADPHMWWLVFADRTGVSGALGYHDLQANGLPYSRIGVRDDMKYGALVSVTATHELAEMLVDPFVDQTVLIDTNKWAKELCDAVEADSQALTVAGVKCSNFVLPAYFNLSAVGPWDHQGTLKGPCPTLTLGGYMAYQDKYGVWHDIFARQESGEHSYRALRHGRRLKRVLKHG